MSQNSAQDKEIIKNLRILALGCKKHPAYRAIRPATGNCQPCVVMWQARQQLTQLEQENISTS